MTAGDCALPARLPRPQIVIHRDTVCEAWDTEAPWDVPPQATALEGATLVVCGLCKRLGVVPHCPDLIGQWLPPRAQWDPELRVVTFRVAL